MILFDVNVLVLTHRRDQEDHEAIRRWLEGQVSSARPFGLADIAVAGFLRIVTNSRIFVRPTRAEIAVAFIDGLVGQPNCLQVAAGPRHWAILREVVLDADARANLIPDAHLAAVAIENGATIATRDRGFARFRGVRWIDPLAQEGVSW